MKARLLFLVMMLAAEFSMAQQNFTMYNMPYVYQRTYQNPALIPNVNVHIGLPIISSSYNSFGNSGAVLEDIIHQRADDSIVVDFGNFISKMKDNNRLGIQSNQDLFSFGIKIAKNYVSLNVTEKFFVGINYPKSFFEFIYYGNGAYLGEEMNFGVDLMAIHYREYGLSYTRELFDKWSIGARVKYLYGMENVWTERSKLSLYTDPDDFAITATSDFLIRTSGTSTDFNDIQGYALGRQNSGFALDLGASYQFTKRLSFAAAVTDIGSIKWNDDVKNYYNAHGETTFTFRGFDLNRIFSDSSDAFAELTDSLARLIDIDSSFEAYSTSIPMKAHISGRYNLTDKFNVGLMLYGMYHDKRFYPGLSASANLQLSKILSASINYSIYNNSFANIGAGFTLNAGPVQWYIMTDNVLGAFQPLNSKNFHVHTGLNLVFGKQKLQKEEPSS